MFQKIVRGIETFLSVAFLYKPCKYEGVKVLVERYFKDAALKPQTYKAVHEVIEHLKTKDLNKYQILVLKFQTQKSTQDIADILDMNERRIHEILESIYNLVHKNLIKYGICDNIFEYE